MLPTLFVQPFFFFIDSLCRVDISGLILDSTVTSFWCKKCYGNIQGSKGPARTEVVRYQAENLWKPEEKDFTQLER